MGGASSQHTSSPSKLLKSKFSFKRKQSNRDQIRPFEELIKPWPIRDLNLLLEEFEADFQLLQLQKTCDVVRRPKFGVLDDLIKGKEAAADLEVTFKTTKIRANRYFLSQRCKKLNFLENSNEISIEQENLLIFEETDVELFLNFWIYTEKWEGKENKETLEKMCFEFGVSKKLKEDLREMARNDAKFGDLEIRIDGNETFSARCSSLVAASRSPIIRSLLLRKLDSPENSKKSIIFSPEIFPRIFAEFFICFLYSDRLEWNLIEKNDESMSSLSLARAITTNRKSLDSQISKNLRIIEMARFFGVEAMVQACEDVIIKNLSVENIIHIHQWARENSSKFIETHSFRFMEKEFSKISTTNSFFELQSEEMEKLTKSQFLQVTELELLDACIRWGELALLKKLEDREPNLVADTCHSISRRGLKKSEKSGEELKEIVKPLTENIRKDYALPPFHHDLTEAIHRGILEQTPLALDLTCSESTEEINPDMHWLKPNTSGPRYFRPYHEALLKFRNSRDPSSKSCPPKSEDLPDLTFRNLYPDLLADEDFLKAKNRIIQKLEELRFSTFQRTFHRDMALSMISHAVLTELDVPEECFLVELTSSDNLENSETSPSSSTPPDVLPEFL